MPRLQLARLNPKIRYPLIAVLFLTLAALFAYDRLHTHERTRAEKTVDCPALEAGCKVELRESSFVVRSDAAIEGGKPFVLSVEGSGVGIAIRAFWRQKGATEIPAYYRMAYAAPERWQAPMQLPAGAAGDWLLHLEINARAVDIATRVR